MADRRKQSQPYINDFAARVKAARDGADYDVKEMADELGLKYDTYLKCESRNPLPHDLIPLFCEKTGVTADWLFRVGKARVGEVPSRRVARAPRRPRTAGRGTARKSAVSP